MADHHDYVALDWVKDEIQETLKQARQALESYVENPEDTTRIRFCLNYIHQVHGTLQMVEFYGAGLLAEEMEMLAQAIMNGQVSNLDEAYQVLMQSILQLPAYLERVQSGRRDLPVILMPILNDMRAARGGSLLSETSLFKPNLRNKNPKLPISALKRFSGDNFTPFISKLRQMYQFALVGVLRDSNLAENLGFMQKVFARLEKLLLKTPVGQLWWVCSGVVEGLSNGAIPMSTTIRHLLRQVDGELRRIMKGGAEALNQPVADELLKNLLYYVAKADDSSLRLREIKDKFGLDDALPDEETVDQQRQLMSGPDREAIGSVVEALTEELVAVKEALDLFVRTGSSDAQALAPQLPALKQISDTMAVLGLGAPRKVLQEQLDLLQEIVDGDRGLDDAVLMDIAGSLLYVEATLSAIADEGAGEHRSIGGADMPAVELSDVHQAVVREARNGLEQAKDAIVQFIGSKWDHSKLEEVPRVLDSVRGGLAMIPLSRSAEQLGTCANFIRHELIASQSIPEWTVLDTLADVIASIEYYLERLTEDHAEQADLLLDVADESLKLLGCAVSSQEASQEPATETLTEIELPIAEELPKEETVAEQNHQEPDAEQAEQVEFDELAEQPEVTTIEAVVEEDEDDDLIDDEVLEIFIEEAQEVHETISEFFPKWRANNQDTDSLAEVRRGFHTLKGSGRMVGATVIGELAWSIENMINRVIDHTITTHPALFELVERVRLLIPSLVDDFQAKAQKETDQVIAYRAEAEAYSKGEEWEAPVVEVDESPEADDALESGGASESQLTEEQEIEITPEVVQESEEDAESELLDIFKGEAETHLEASRAFVEMYQEKQHPLTITENLQRALHTLKGSAYMAGITPVATVVSPLEKLIKELRGNLIKADQEVIEALGQGIGLIQNGLDNLTIDPERSIAGSEEFLHHLQDIQNRYLDAKREEDEESGRDTQALIVFLAEGMDLLLDVHEWLPEWAAHCHPDESYERLQKELDTLSRTSLMADLAPIAELSETLKSIYRALSDKILLVDDELLALLSEAHEELINMLDRMAAQQSVDMPDALLARLKQLQNSVLPTDFDVEEVAIAADTLALEVDEFEQELEAGLEPLEQSDESTSSAPESNNDAVDEDIVLDSPELLEDLQSQFGGLEASDAEEIDLALPVVDVVDEDLSVLVDTDEADSELEEVELALPELDVDSHPSTPASAEQQEDNAERIVFDADPELIEIFLEEANDIMDSTATSLQNWMEDTGRKDEIDQLQRDLHTLKGGARMAGISPIGDLSHELEFLYEGFGNGRYEVSPALFELIQTCHDRLADQIDDLGTSGSCIPAQALIDAISRYRASPSGEVDVEVRAERDTNSQELDAVVEDETTTMDTDSDLDTSPGEALEAVFDQLDFDEIDADILEIFLEEAGDLQEGIEQTCDAWSKEPANQDAAAELMRQLHTLKGGARMAAIKHLGDFTHDFEMMVTRAQQDLQNLPENMFEDVMARQDLLFKHLQNIRGQVQGDSPVAPEAVTQESNVVAAEDESAAILPFAPRGKDLATVEQDAPAVMGAAEALKQPRRMPQEMVKISADILENLVNLAGETSISRGRIEQEVSDFGFTLDEMHSTIDRVREQLRRLDIETQTQIISRHELEGGVRDVEFDPLEMDQYSELAQLSRSLVESATDLMDLKDGLTNKARDAETLLLQQGRINTELQEGLMHTRMVPFSRMMPRLRRIVRQVSGELGKRVELEVLNADGEMDRTVMERMVAPLEHMLRNAVDHGIESDLETRRESGKSDKGHIRIAFSREGGDVVLRLSDDGQGVNLAAVRNKAIERGLMDQNSSLTDHEVMQFILQAGFSTAKEVTQISGRGVGMDVVHSEIKQLGGNVTIHSKPGEGTTFVVRLPFTVSVNRALMVYVGDDLYAIPLNTIEGVLRISPYELEAYYEDPSLEFDYAGQGYQVRYLGEVMKQRPQPSMEGVTVPLPVLLTRGAEHSVALQVDSLAGSREIVVKTLGAQFSGVDGVSGATILGDGRVVIILDLVAMIRSDFAHQALPMGVTIDAEVVEVKEERRQQVVMVVDDSVTVRKVTSRLLERQGYEVLLAKDGVDAIAQLQDKKPDIMLLDIEMPRMDGFEVASSVKNDRRLGDLPIIMITSRTGEKHRERAFSIGVNEYLGKPFQEADLLATIEKLLNVDEQQH